MPPTWNILRAAHWKFNKQQKWVTVRVIVRVTVRVRCYRTGSDTGYGTGYGSGAGCGTGSGAVASPMGLYMGDVLSWFLYEFPLCLRPYRIYWICRIYWINSHIGYIYFMLLKQIPYAPKVGLMRLGGDAEPMQSLLEVLWSGLMQILMEV